jgi:UDP-N-acetylglucosamine--N-acetylmuramyl-(pentapeptide) pyrophosphoryl-undecaprenol N-acetylglucosamine transferase
VRILVSYEETRGGFPVGQRERVLVLGNPIRGSIRRGDPAKGRAMLGAPAGLPVLLFLGGSQGARQVNELALAILPDLAAEAFVVHQTGEAALGAEGAVAGAAAGRYRAYGYIREEMPDILAAADLVVGRAGAGTLWECSALGKPMVLVPLCGSGTRGDQVDNARLFEARGAAVALVGGDAAPAALLSSIRGMLGDRGKLAAAGAAARELAGADAAEAAAALIIERIGGIA